MNKSFLRVISTFCMAAHFSAALLADSMPVPLEKPHLAAAHLMTKSAPPSEPDIVWLDGAPPAVDEGTTWGMPWPRGKIRTLDDIILRDKQGNNAPLQNWPLAWWPDGSIKWSAHACSPGNHLGEGLSLTHGAQPSSLDKIFVNDAPDCIKVDTGALQCVLAREGKVLIREISRRGRTILLNGSLRALADEQASESDQPGSSAKRAYQSLLTKVTIEQQGPLRATIKLEGVHSDERRRWLPFVVRLYFFAGSEHIRLLHSFVFDGDASSDFIRGIGLSFEVAMSDRPYDRHIRFAGDKDGIWGEAVQGLTGLGKEPDLSGSAIRDAQIEGQVCPPLATFNPYVVERLQYVPTWGDYTLQQPNANGFTIRKRTKAGHGWIEADQGHRSAGLGYLGGATQGGVSFGVGDFWQRHPGQLDIRKANTDRATVNVWFHSPEAPPMDLRFYHDGMGMDSFEKQVNGGLRITYEDFEPGYGEAYGIARSTELHLWVHESTPSRARLAALASYVQTPPRLVCTPARLVENKVFGGLLSLPDHSTPARQIIERRLAWELDYYLLQVKQRHWYGFWNYGDIMHTYDSKRHVWRYDVGGFAWDNSELSSDLWLWMSYLRTGRPDVFRLAEAMTRHTSEVDSLHLGRFAGLGSRHNVQHWGCSAKQVRISTPAYRRIYYYLTADERTGDLMRETLSADTKLAAVDPVRKIGNADPLGDNDARVSFGTDWANLAASWLTEWERGGDLKYRDKLLRGMRDFGAMPKGFLSSSRFGYQIATGSLKALRPHGQAETRAAPIELSHLNGVFGAVEVFAELIQVTEGMPEQGAFKSAWLQYCRLYNAPKAERIRELGVDLSGGSLRQAHSRLTAFAARMQGDGQLARRAWKQFNQNDYKDERGNVVLATQRISGPAVLNPIDEATWVSTNISAQWGLAAMENLALISDQLE